MKNNEAVLLMIIGVLLICFGPFVSSSELDTHTFEIRCFFGSLFSLCGGSIIGTMVVLYFKGVV